MTNEEFEALEPVITYDDWEISVDENERYFVRVIEDDEIYEVELVHKEENVIGEGDDVVDFGGDFDGESDDMQWLMSFVIKEK
ncbi:MAG: hypothetical protein MJZ23_05040 [Paludibacteraceae bacterium]|nr:hypothetical protein [Paludibacteraceae bacterium]